MIMKKIRDRLLAIIGSDAFAVIAILALAYAYIKCSLTAMEFLAER